MSSPQSTSFERFVKERKKDLQRIASHTRGEHKFADVVNEAWIMASSLAMPEGKVFDLGITASQKLLLSHLYQHLIRYTEQNIRHAVRLDHAPAGSSQEDDVHPLMYILVSENSREPLQELLEREAAAARDCNLEADHSLASAYVRLLHHFDNRMRMVADHLLISRSHAYRRCAHAQLLATHQKPVPAPMMDECFIPGPWRNFQLRRFHIQLAFDFDDELPIQSAH